MPTPNDLIRQVQKTVKDKTYDEQIFTFFNDCLREIDDSENPLILIESLRTTDTVSTVAYDSTTPVAYVNMPATYKKHLFKVESAAEDTSDIKIRPNLRNLLEVWDTFDNQGAVEDVVVANDILWYQSIPTAADTLTLYFYKAITELTLGDNSEITIIPSGLQKSLLCSYASAQILLLKANATQAGNYFLIYQDALKKLARHNRHSSRGEQWVRAGDKKVGYI